MLISPFFAYRVLGATGTPCRDSMPGRVRVTSTVDCMSNVVFLGDARSEQQPDPAPAPLPSDEEALDAYSRVVTDVARRLAPSVANLRVMRRVRGGLRTAGGGSAVVITPDGFLLTSAHVVARADGARASLVDGRDGEA